MKNMMENGLIDKLRPVLTHQYNIDDYETGFATMMGGQSGKVVLHWD